MISFNDRVIWLPVYNTTAETIPGCALMEIVANPPTDNGQDVNGNWLVRKPTIDSNTRVIVNSEAEIPPGETGRGHRDNNAVLLYDTTEDLPLCNDQYGAKNGSWMAHRNYSGFRIDHAGNGRANASRDLSGGSGSAQNAVMITSGTLVTPGGGDLPYYAATEQSLSSGAWTTGATVRAINTGPFVPKAGEKYPATFIGYAVDGVTKCYAMRTSQQHIVQIGVGTLVTPGGTDLPYYAGTEYTLNSTGAYASVDTIRVINLGSADPKPSKKYPANFIGFASDGVTKCYAIKSAKTGVITDASISCTAGTVTLSTTTTYLDVDTW